MDDTFPPEPELDLVNRALILDQDADFRGTLARALKGLRYQVQEEGGVPDSPADPSQKGYDLIIAGSRSPDIADPELLRRLKDHSPGARIVLLVREATIEGAVRALQLGASDYVARPVATEELLRRIEELPGRPGARSSGASWGPATPSAEAVFAGIVGSSPAMKELRRLIQRVATAESTVLVTGETGTGKELVARAIHRTSPRRHAPFVPINCGAIPETLLESQLFGHLRGAFTGADRDREGFFRTAGEGTIFLDEIGELPLALQPKILRALDAREYLPVGSTQPQPVRARVIVATNRDLRTMLKTGQFRQDLYFRLSTVEVPITPLRERLEDIAPTANFLMDRAARGLSRTALAINPGALSALEAYHWPGNVRELANVLERALILSGGEAVRLEDLPAFMAHQAPPPLTGSLRTARRAFERRFAQRAVEACGGDKNRAARMIGISLPSLYRKLCLPEPEPPRST
jgi:two-component system response regulator AtoC